MDRIQLKDPLDQQPAAAQEAIIPLTSPIHLDVYPVVPPIATIPIAFK